MPQVQNTNVSDCICAVAEELGPAKATFIAFIDSLIAVLQVFKIAEQLESFNAEDLIRKAALEVALAVHQAVVAEMAAGINTVIGIANRSADCPPMAVYMRKVKKWRDDFLNPLYEEEYEIQQYIAAIDDKQKKVSQIQQAIDWLTTFRDAIEICGGD
jgi:hypothetical protein